MATNLPPVTEEYMCLMCFGGDHRWCTGTTTRKITKHKQVHTIINVCVCSCQK